MYDERDNYPKYLKEHKEWFGKDKCERCCCGYPDDCDCGGKKHVVEIDEVPCGDDDWTWVHYTMCDKCGRIN